jgi:protein O-mannosyl-transferase
MVAGAAVYLNALDGPFVYDDFRLVDENRALRDVSDIRTLLLSNVSRPIVAVSYAIDRAIWGPAPFGFHLTNLALHLVNVLLLFIVGHLVTTDRHARFPADAGAPSAGSVAFIAALLLAVHPVATEAVTYVTGRADLLATAFTLLALLAARRWLMGGSGRWLVLAVALWVCGTVSKETTFVFPFILVAYIHFTRPMAPRTEQRKGLTLLMLTVGVLTVGRLVLFFTVEYPQAVSLQWGLAATQIDVLRQYLGLIIAPHDQTIFHVVPAFRGLFDRRVWMSIAVLGAVVAWIRIVRARVPLAAWGMVWFLLALLPPVVLILFDRGEPMAERRVYLAACGAFLAAGAIGARAQALLKKRGRVAAWSGRLALAFIALSLAGRTVERNQVWGDRIGLWTEAARLGPGHWVPLLALGEALHDAGRHADAVTSFERSIAVHDTEPAAFSKLGVCLIEIGRPADAERAFTRLAMLSPRSPQAFNGLAAAALASGQSTVARERFLRTLEIDPLNVESRYGLAAIALAEHDAAEVAHRCAEIALLAPRDPRPAVCEVR